MQTDVLMRKGVVLLGEIGGMGDAAVVGLAWGFMGWLVHWEDADCVL